MPLLALRSINRSLLTLEAGGEITSSPAGLLGWIFTVLHPFALAAEVTYAAHVQPCARRRNRVGYLSPRGNPEVSLTGETGRSGKILQRVSPFALFAFFLLLLLLLSNDVFVAFVLFQ